MIDRSSDMKKIILRMHQPIAELFNKQGSYTWVHKSNDHYRAVFSVKGMNFQIDFNRVGASRKRNNWETSFGLMDTGFEPDFGNTGYAGNSSIQVFAQVVAATRDFLKTKQPDKLMFSGNKEDGKDRLYRAISQRMKIEADSIGYAIDEIETGDYYEGSAEFAIVKKQSFT